MGLTPIEQLDDVLKQVLKRNGVMNKSIDILLYYKNNKIISEYDIDTILKKLRKDNYVEYNNLSDTWSITFEGKLFISLGGYSTHEVLKMQNQKAFLFRERLLAYGSAGAAIGTFALLLYYLLN